MNTPRFSLALLAALLATPLCAQTTGKPLNLKLPSSSLPATASTSAASSTSTASSNVASVMLTSAASSTTPAHAAPGVYYGDTSGNLGNTEVATDTRSDCDDSTYNQPQIHGSVSTGIASGSHMGTGNWNAGEVNISKAFGSCDDPSGGVSISVGGSRSHFPDRRGR